mgnify:CR=1 FL=1
MFFIAFKNVLIMLLYMSCGFTLVKTGKAHSEHAKSLSAVLIYLCGPSLIISAFQDMTYSLESACDIGLFFVITLTIQIVSFAILYIVLHRKYDDAKYRILSCGAVMGNVGFFGMPMVMALFPNEPVVACYSTMYSMSMNLLVFTMGVFLITHNRKFITPKSALLNPTSIAIFLSLPMYFLDVHLPAELGSAVSLLGKMTTPVCMLILGMRLASVSLRKLFSRPFVYLVCGLKLLVYPMFAYLCVLFLPFVSATFKACILVLSAAPTGAMLLSLAELHGCEQEMSANVVLLATIFCVVTLPLVVLIV